MPNYKLQEKILKKSFYVAVSVIEKLFGYKKSTQKIDTLYALDEGTIGYEIAKCLKENNLNLVPYFESHDLKHALLNFKMTPLDEIRLQAFMIGNGNFSIPSLAIFIYGIILLPNKWMVFFQDFNAGQKAIPIKNWSIEEYANNNLKATQKRIFNQRQQSTTLMKKLTLSKISQYGSFIIITAGIFGMLFCLPFLWSSNIADLIGAGFPFIAGAILIIGGLINLSLISRELDQKEIII